MKIKSIAIFAGVLALVTAGTTQAAPVIGQGTWETTLLGRDLDGNAATYEAYYDTTLEITWLTNANIDGQKTWPTANDWAADLNIHGVTGWRLPTMLDTGTPGCISEPAGTDCGYNVQTGSASTILTEYSEMASLFYDTLGNLAYFDTAGNPEQLGWGLSNTGPFSNLQSNFYWSGLELAHDTNAAWLFNFFNGYQGDNLKFTSYYAWAVHSGDVGAVPVPAAVWLFGSGILGLIGFSKRKKAAA